MPNRAFHCLDGTPLRRPETALGGGARVVWNDGLLDAYLGWARQTGFRDYAVRIAGRLHVVAVERESVRAVLNDQADFQRNIAPTKHLFGAGMLRLTGEAWRVRRVMTTPPFRREGLGSAQPIVVDEVDRLLDRWRARGGEPFRPSRDLSRCMASILGRYLFGFELGAQDRPALHESLIALSVDSVLRHLLPRPAAILLNRWAVHRARRVLDALCGEILDRGGKTVFLEALRAAMAAGQLDRRTAIDEIRTFLIAGHETSATALSWMIAVLAERPEIQEDLRQESCGVDLRGGAPTDLLVRTTAVIRESLRLYPAVPISVLGRGRAKAGGAATAPSGAGSGPVDPRQRARVTMSSVIIPCSPCWSRWQCSIQRPAAEPSPP